MVETRGKIEPISLNLGLNKIIGEDFMLRNIVFIFLIGLVVIFVLQNTQVVEVRFLFWTISMSRALILFATLAIGLIGGWLLTFPKRRKALLENRKK
jgi:uncharacterized integral membrane protein